MNKAMIYARALRGTIPSSTDFEKLEDFFGILPDGSDGEIHKVIADNKMVELLRMLFDNTVGMCIITDLWETSQEDFPAERSRVQLIN